MPHKMRDIISEAILQFRDGVVSKKDVDTLLKKNFSDKTFQSILHCTQGDLAECKKIDLDKWKSDAKKDVSTIAAHARKKQ